MVVSFGICDWQQHKVNTSFSSLLLFSTFLFPSLNVYWISSYVCWIFPLNHNRQSVLCWRIYLEKFSFLFLNRNGRNENNQIMSMSPRKSRNSRVYISIKYHQHTHWIGSHKISPLKSPAIIYVRITNKKPQKKRAGIGNSLWKLWLGWDVALLPEFFSTVIMYSIEYSLIVSSVMVRRLLLLLRWLTHLGRRRMSADKNLLFAVHYSQSGGSHSYSGRNHYSQIILLIFNNPSSLHSSPPTNGKQDWKASKPGSFEWEFFFLYFADCYERKTWFHIFRECNKSCESKWEFRIFLKK